MSAVICYYLFYAHCLHARAVLFTHTLTRSLSDDPGFTRPDIGRFVAIVQVFDETVRFARSWILSLLILVFLHFLIPVIILWFRYIILTFYFIPYFIWDSCVALICIIAVISYYDCNLLLVQITLGLAYICGVISSRIYVADLCRDSVFTYFGKRGMTGFSWYQSQVRHKTDLILTDNLNEL